MLVVASYPGFPHFAVSLGYYRLCLYSAGGAHTQHLHFPVHRYGIHWNFVGIIFREIGKRLAQRNFHGFNFREYAACLVVRPTFWGFYFRKRRLIRKINPPQKFRCTHGKETEVFVQFGYASLTPHLLIDQKKEQVTLDNPSQLCGSPVAIHASEVPVQQWPLTVLAFWRWRLLGAVLTSEETKWQQLQAHTQTSWAVVYINPFTTENPRTVSRIREIITFQLKPIHWLIHGLNTPDKVYKQEQINLEA